MSKTVELCSHVIEEDEIVGIGPLMIITPSDQIEEMYKVRKLTFNVHLRNQSLKIESPKFTLGIGDGSEEEKQAKARFDEWQKQYKEAKEAVLKIIENR